MNISLRITIAVAVVAVLALLGYALTVTPPGNDSSDSASDPRRMTNADCQGCHQTQWDQWQSSLHAQSWTHVNVQAAFQHFGNDRKCESCHAPVPVYATGLANAVEFREDDHASGVNCLTCHLLPDRQGVAATRTLADAPCRPRREPSLTTSQHCAGCHVPIFADWQASRYAAEGKNCQSCHMRGTNSNEAAVSHACVTVDNEALLRSGIRMTAQRVGGEITVAAENHATGHNFPGERHNRVLLIRVIQRDGSGSVTSALRESIKEITPFRGESSSERLKPDEVYTARFPVVAASTTARVELIWKRFPWYSDDEALVLHAAELELSEDRDAAEPAQPDA